MIAIFIKELRENLKWAGLIALLVIFLLAHAMDSDLSTGLSLVGSMIASYTMLVFPAAGLAMGLLAILPDTGRGRWQFMMHRPIQWGRIFAAKVLAAVTLYLLATLLPLLAIYAWAAVPGHVPGPVTADLLLPRLADLLGGIVWLFSGMLCAARRARWIGSRLVAVGFAMVAATLAAALSMYFAEFILIAGAGAVVLLIAARVAQIERGELPARNWVARTCAGIALAVGWVIVVACAFGLLASLMEPLVVVVQTSPRTSYGVLDNGQVMQFDDTGAKDLAGKRIEKVYADEHTIDISWCSLQQPSAKWNERLSYRGFHHELSHVRVIRTQPDLDSPLSWFYSPTTNAITGYARDGGLYAGSLGPDGWSSTPQPFPEGLDQLAVLGDYHPIDHVLAAGDRTVWKIDFRHRLVTPSFTADPGDVILNARSLDTSFYTKYGTGPRASSDYSNLIVTRAAVYLFPDGQQPFKLPPQYRAPAYPFVGIGRMHDGRWILINDERSLAEKLQTPQAALFLSAEGQPLQQISLSRLPATSTANPPWDQVCEALAIPPGLLVGLTSFHVMNDFSGPAFTLGIPLGAGVLCLLLTIPLARKRQYSAAGTGAWAALNLLLGIPGVLLLLSMDDAVPTVRCESCVKPRPITQEKCPHCAAHFASPENTGIEIFAVGSIEVG